MTAVEIAQIVFALITTTAAIIASIYTWRLIRLQIKLERQRLESEENSRVIQDRQKQMVEEISEFRKTLMTQTLSVAPQFAFHPYQELRPSTASSDITLLVTDVIPYLNALINTQNTIDEISGREYREVRIKTITQHSPISVSLDGAGEAIEVLNKIVIPWKRKHHEQMAHLIELEKLAEIEIKKAEVLERRAHAAKDRQEADKLAADTLRQKAEAEKLQLENEKLRWEIHRARIHLALDVLVKFEPNLPEALKTSYAVRLLPSLQVLTESLLQISIDQEHD